MKAGTGASILPGRHPVLVAKQLASLAALAPGRVLPVFALRPWPSVERTLFPVPRGERGAVFDESMVLLRRLLTVDAPVTFKGRFFDVTDASVGPLPVKPLDIWLGGSAPPALRRVGRLGDGWLGSFVTPAEAGEAVRTIKRAAADAGREVEEDHFGISFHVYIGRMPEEYVQSVTLRRPGVPLELLSANGWDDAKRLISAYAEAGLSKFVVYKVGQNVSFPEFLDGFTRELMPLQT